MFVYTLKKGNKSLGKQVFTSIFLHFSSKSIGLDGATKSDTNKNASSAAFWFKLNYRLTYQIPVQHPVSMQVMNAI